MVVRPLAPQELEDRMAAAKKSAVAARTTLDEIDAEYARALYEGVDQGQLAEIESRRKTASQRLDQALSSLPLLVEEARAAGVSESVLKLYQHGVVAE